MTLDHALGQRRNQGRLRRRQGIDRIGARDAGESIGVVQQVQHRRDHRGAGDHADHQGHLLLPRRGIDQLPGLEVLQIVVGDGRHREHHRSDEQGEGDQGRAAIAAEQGLDPKHQQQGRADHHQDADAGQRAVGGADQPGHIAAHCRHQEAHQHHVDQAAQYQGQGVLTQAALVGEAGQQPGDGRQADQRDQADQADRNILFGARQGGALAGLAYP